MSNSQPNFSVQVVRYSEGRQKNKCSVTGQQSRIVNYLHFLRDRSERNERERTQPEGALMKWTWNNGSRC